MTKNFIDSRYVDGKYLNKTTTWHTEDSPYKAKIVKQSIKRNNILFSTCADIGCGAGLVTEILSNYYPNSIFDGYELSKDVDVFWKDRKKVSNLDFSHDNLLEKSKIYDLVICLDVFEHIEDYFYFLRNLRNCGNEFIFNVPLDMCVIKLITSGIKKARREVGHLHYFNKYTAMETIRDSGYKIVEARLCAAFMKNPPRNIRQVIAFPFRLLSMLFGKSVSSSLFGGMSLLVVAKPC